jgi:hypothetical protein
MYIRVTSYSYKPGTEEEVSRFQGERLMSAARQLAGFRRYISAIDRDASGRISITEWDERGHAENLRTALSSLLAEIADHGIQLEATPIYEMQIQS